MKNLSLILLLVLTRFTLAQTNPCDSFNVLNTQVRDGLISKEEALTRIRELIPEVRGYFFKHGGTEITKDDWVFPLEGYNSASIGGSKGSGYQVSGFDYFDGNNHSGHPAHDIFIHDKNQDWLDDYTQEPVNVLSVCNGVVIAYETEWETNSDLRGGKYIYIYDPGTEGIFYFAHNSEVLVKPGDVVKAGDVIAHVGRTGLNAYKKRSPTHLHLMYMYLEDGYPKPRNIYEELLNAKNK
jgi:hypothetical protein